MRSAPLWLLTIAVAVGVLAGCASPTTNPMTAATPETSGAHSSAGMVMPHLTTASPAPGRPTATAALICGDEIKEKVQQMLQLQTPVHTSSTFAANVFTCRYTLPQGPMRPSVQHSATKAAALADLQVRRRIVRAHEVTLGLGERAYSTGTGVVLAIKDNVTLEIDTTGLPDVFGNEQQKRTDLAYEIASDVLGCWTGDDD